MESIDELFSKRQETHPALGEGLDPGADAWEPLWDWVLANDVYRSWQRDDTRWMLRCVGGPGSGKTTLSAIVTKKLNEAYGGRRQAVASVFVLTDVASGGTAFVEDVLASVFRQLCARITTTDTEDTDTSTEQDEAAAEECLDKYHLYLEAREHGHRDIFRIQLLRDALQSRLAGLDRAFLVVDDFDRCSPVVDLFLENELAMLARLGLRVMLTSRVPCLKAAPTKQECDSCEESEYPRRKHLLNYWRCERCRRTRGVKQAHILCQDCKDAGRTCANCGESANFVQPFDHIDLQLDVFQTQLAVARFIDWDLETEHGDLGLGSRSSSSSSSSSADNPTASSSPPTPDNIPKDSRLVLPLPPRSAFGRRLADPRNREALASLREQTLAQARGNVGLARLRLENVHASQSLSAAQADALPANVVAFFDAGVRRIEEQPPALRDLGLKVIAAVAHYDFGEGVEYAVLDRILRNTAKAAARRQQPSRTQSAPVVGTGSSSSYGRSSSKTTMASATETAPHVPHRSLEEMLHAARGFVVVGALGHRPLEAYCESFHAYARENYSEALVWAHAQLDFGDDGPAGGLVGIGSSKGAMRRSRTGVAHFVEKRDQAATQRPLPFGRLQERQFGIGGVGDDWAAGERRGGGGGGGGRAAAGRSAAPDGATAGAGADAAEADADADADAYPNPADANTNMDCSGARGEMPKEQDALRAAVGGAKKTAPSTGSGRDPSFRMVKRPTWA